LKPKFWLMFLGGGLQGFVGWYMVASGLTERVDVSQYRLAAHLGLAVLLFSYIYWVAIGLRREESGENQDQNSLASPAYFITGLIFFQIIAGAFVAGLKAGKAHNTWPLMDGRFIPNGLDAMTPYWKNLFENVLTVQFNHRMIAYVIAIVVFLHFIQCLLSKNGLAIKGAVILLVFTLFQITLGIVTLLQFVPLDLALYHQGGAVILLTASLWHSRNLYGAN
jgi:cytochrome c oxidase assembly protein subunit 15